MAHECSLLENYVRPSVAAAQEMTLKSDEENNFTRRDPVEADDDIISKV